MKFRAWIAAAALLGVCSQGLAAEGDKDYPAKPVRIVVNVPPGGVADLVARLLAAKFSESFGQPFIVENRPRANQGRSRNHEPCRLHKADPLEVRQNLGVELGHGDQLVSGKR